MKNSIKVEEMQNEEMCVLVAPDGACQLSTLAPDYAMCVAMIQLLHKKGISKSYHEMVIIGEYEIMPIKVSVIANGTAEDAFNRFKQSI